MKKPFFIILGLILVAGLSWYGWQNRHKYFFQGDEGYETVDEDADAEGILEEEDNLNDDVVDGEDLDEEDDEDEFVSEENEYDAPSITSKNCDNNCQDFSGDELVYCREICGFAEDDPDRKADDCEELKKLERDACYKQKAVDEKDAGVCKKISDPDLRENCENRVLEEVLK